MPISTRKLGPGTLTLGTGALAVTSQLTGCKVSPSESVESGETVKVLSGETVEDAGTATYTYTLEGNFLQDDPGVTSVVDWSWDNAGTEQDFVFVPNTEGGREVSGVLVPVPLAIGADEIDERMASDFTWRCVGTPSRAILP